MRAAVRHGQLHVVDFGGALGSTYAQSRVLINAASDVCWAIVEQPAYAAAGAEEFGNHELSFHDSIDAARQHADFDVLLLSGVIQYLPDPLGFLDSVLALEFPTVILDRTPFMVDGVARLTVQHVPESIYPASYPAWFFSETELLAKVAAQYDLVASWPALDDLHPEGGRAEYKGFLFEAVTA
jgi:putative methyltransferase (TIGR04325 family)